MFDYTLIHWTAFISAAILLNLSPGPDIAFILGQTAKSGARAGFAAMFGTWTSALMHVGMAAPEFANFDGRNPVLQSGQIVLLGWDYDGCNSDWERKMIIRRNTKVVPLEELKADAGAAAKRALAMLGPVDRVVVHFDVDVIDFADCPLSENYRHGEGCTLEQAMAALSVLASKQEFAGVTVTELNPDHGEEDLVTLKRFSKSFAQALAGNG